MHTFNGLSSLVLLSDRAVDGRIRDCDLSQGGPPRNGMDKQSLERVRSRCDRIIVKELLSLL